MHTSELIQYGTVIGKKVYLYRRPKRTGKRMYTHPVLIGIVNCKSKKEAEEAKAEFDKPIRH